MNPARARAWQPEAALVGFTFLLHFSWEILQVPFFESISDRPHWEAVRACLQATVGDVGLMLLGYEVVATSRGRRWLLRESWKPLATMVLFLVAGTVLLEWLSVDVWGRWAYAPAMPTLPIVGTGLTPVLQWLFLPPVTVWLARRHLQGRATDVDSSGPRGTVP